MQMNKDGMVTIRSAITSMILAVWQEEKVEGNLGENGCQLS